MDALKIVIRKDALKFIEQTTEWYNNNLKRLAPNDTFNRQSKGDEFSLHTCSQSVKLMVV